MRLIDADALKHELKVKRDYLDDNTAVGRGKYIALNKAITMLDEQPTVDANHIADDGKKVDAVQVVRCRECKMYIRCTNYQGLCNRIDGFINPDWYCADGEKDDSQ